MWRRNDYFDQCVYEEKNDEQITILLKNDANQTIFKEFNIFLYKKLIYVLERPNVVKTIGIPVDIICSFFSGALANSLFYLVQKTTITKEQKNRLRIHSF